MRGTCRWRPGADLLTVFKVPEPITPTTSWPLTLSAFPLSQFAPLSDASATASSPVRFAVSAERQVIEAVGRLAACMFVTGRYLRFSRNPPINLVLWFFATRICSPEQACRRKPQIITRSSTTPWKMPVRPADEFDCANLAMLGHVNDVYPYASQPAIVARSGSPISRAEDPGPDKSAPAGRISLIVVLTDKGPRRPALTRAAAENGRLAAGRLPGRARAPPLRMKMTTVLRTPPSPMTSGDELEGTCLPRSV